MKRPINSSKAASNPVKHHYVFKRAKSVIAQTAGILRTDQPTLTAEAERDLAAEAMAKEEIESIDSSQLPNPLLHRR